MSASYVKEVNKPTETLIQLLAGFSEQARSNPPITASTATNSRQSLQLASGNS